MSLRPIPAATSLRHVIIKTNDGGKNKRGYRLASIMLGLRRAMMIFNRQWIVIKIESPRPPSAIFIIYTYNEYFISFVCPISTFLQNFLDVILSFCAVAHTTRVFNYWHGSCRWNFILSVYLFLFHSRSRSRPRSRSRSRSFFFDPTGHVSNYSFILLESSPTLLSKRAPYVRFYRNINDVIRWNIFLRSKIGKAETRELMERRERKRMPIE